MNVSVTFEPSGISGLVAQGTYLIDAAKRLGAPLGGGCTAGKGECPACVISIKSGADLLSIPTSAESRVLGVEGLNDSLRLVCQVKIEGQGEIVLAVTTHRNRPGAPAVDLSSDIEKKFGELNLNQKIAALLKFEAITMSEAFDAALQKPLALGTRAFDSIMSRARAAKANAAKPK
ncbi:MAG TPA: 2Fe-2S iron-sulfur cluster-binding protein [Pyrinomonadaceae bacterium]|nr:2Fe-2S iron-sulfur cluster-binding protein [Pyrinomonadaceae bacterium]